jgi:sulfur-oxidizing protein SoxY
MIAAFVTASALALMAIPTVSPARADAGPELAFDAIKSEVFGARPILDGRGIVTLDAPYRPDDVRAVPLDIAARFADGRTVRAVTVIVDNNPMPVVAAFTIGQPRADVGLGLKFRLNQQSNVRAVVEASDGRLYMTSRLVKFAGGQAACAAPPSAPPEVIAANLGKMALTEVASKMAQTEVASKSGTQSRAAAQSSLTPRLRFELSHPNHTGMVLDQITLLYTPVRMVERMTVRQGEKTVLEMLGSIALSENPVVEFDIARTTAADVAIAVTDTDGAKFERTFPFGAGS